ncbi:MAG: PLP-dependent aminotransferase family protein [Pseudomonadota bacterium]
MPKPAGSHPVRIDRRSPVAIHQQLYDRIRIAIDEGRMTPGERLPSTRSLAVQLGVARGTVDAAYARLAGEGYIMGRGQGGTIVSLALRRNIRPARPNGSPPAIPGASAETLLPLRMGLPALDLFPRKLWARLAAREARTRPEASQGYPDPMGLPVLRDAIASYLAISRGIACRPEQIVITNGYQAALNLAAGIVLAPGDTVWFEDPGYGFARDALQSLSMRIAPVPVDDEGLCVAYGQRYFSRARLAVVTPAHQSPLGVCLSLPRRQALQAWAAEADSWILEDDYDCEFHYSGHKPPALKSIDGSDRVFYAGSFSKTLFPGLRLGYLVLPHHFVPAAAKLCRELHRGEAAFEQGVVATFITNGHFARHLRRMRMHYKARRQALADALIAQFGEGIRLSLQPGGLHILARFPGHGGDVALAARALRHGLRPSPLSAQSIKHDAGEGLLMSFTNIPEKAAPDIAARLRSALG